MNWRTIFKSGCGCFSSNPGAGKISYLTLIRAIAITLVSAAAYAGTILLAPRQWQPPLLAPKRQDDLHTKRTSKDAEFLLHGE
jgi:hypothetical protein